MSNFATEAFARLQKQYNAMDDFGPGPLFAVIQELIADGNQGPAMAVAGMSALINMNSDPFIVEGETSNNEVFIEVMRRVFFHEDVDSLTPEYRDSYRRSIMQMSVFLSDFGHRVNVMMLPAKGAANDERA